MFRHLLILPDGSELFSGSDTQNAIIGVTVRSWSMTIRN